MQLDTQLDYKGDSKSNVHFRFRKKNTELRTKQTFFSNST